MKSDKTPEQLYEERIKRIDDATRIEVPDRIPIITSFSYFPAKYTGITCEDMIYDFDKYSQAMKKTILDFEPESFSGPAIDPGRVLETLQAKNVKWPGHGVSPFHTHQAVELETLKADEYDAFLANPGDFILRTYLPRIYGVLEPFADLPPIDHVFFGGGNAISSLITSGCEPAIEALLKAGREYMEWHSKAIAFYAEMKKLGFPTIVGATARAPFDAISDNLRGMRGTMLDMYRNPDKLLEACDKFLPMQIERGISGTKKTGNTRVFIPLHRGAEGFMSIKQFETFYWPGLKQLLLGLIDGNTVPYVFFEGDFTSRLEYLLEIPKGKIIAHLDQTDMSRAKEIIGKQICLMGNVPSSLLQTSSPQEVKDYCKELIDIAGKDGGFIMAPRSSIDEAKPENLKAMFDITREYGIYR
jgi:hypothetical protein